MATTEKRPFGLWVNPCGDAHIIAGDWVNVRDADNNVNRFLCISWTNRGTIPGWAANLQLMAEHLIEHTDLFVNINDITAAARRDLSALEARIEVLEDNPPVDINEPGAEWNSTLADARVVSEIWFKRLDDNSVVVHREAGPARFEYITDSIITTGSVSTIGRYYINGITYGSISYNEDGNPSSISENNGGRDAWIAAGGDPAGWPLP